MRISQGFQYPKCPSFHGGKNAISPWQKRSLWGNIDWSKAFDCISHDLLIAKLNAYGFDQNARNVICNDLFGKPQKTKVGSSFSNLLDILYDVPKGSILGPLFNINLCELFLSWL